MAEAARVTSDALLGGRIALRQPADGYRVAIDPVLLAAAVPAAAGEHVLDVGCGVGAAALCLATRVPGLHVTGIELDRTYAQLAHENVALNRLEDRVDILLGDLERPPPRLAPRSFDHVFANPPYFAEEAHRASPNPGKAQANTERTPGLDGWLTFCFTMVRPGGSITVIHKPDRLGEILGFLDHARAGDAVVYPFWSHNPFIGARIKKNANRVIVRAVADRGGPLRLAGGMVLHEADGQYTHAADCVLRRGQGLELREAPLC
jgi:tRNA1(Val) A37 N6-methylase TrmN6